MTLITEALPDAETAGVALFVAVGSAQEKREEHGISHFLEHLLFKGSESKTALQLAQEMDRLGSSFNAATGKEYTVFHAHVPSTSLKEALLVLFDIVFVPSFTESDVSRERQIVLEEIREEGDDPDYLAHETLLERAWRRSPYGHSILGSGTSLSALRKKEVLQHHKSFYTPSNMVLAIAGSVNHGDALKMLERAAGKINGTPHRPRKRHKSPLSFTPHCTFVKKETEQVHFCMAFPGTSFLSQKIYPFILLDAALGSGVSSRLFYRIREKKGLAYSIYSYLQSLSAGGLLTIYTSSAQEKWKKALQSVLRELKQLRAKGISQRELELAKKSLEAHWLLGLESTLNRAYKIGREWLFLKRVIPTQESLNSLHRVHRRDIQEIAQSFRPSQLALSLVGPLDSGEKRIVQNLVSRQLA